MKKYILSIWTFTIITAVASGQVNQLWATANLGGSSNVGTIIKGDINGNFHLVHTLTPIQGSYPLGLLAYSGNYIFGCCQLGGPSGSCTLFRIDTGSLAFTMLHDFGNVPITGEYPTAGLIKFTDGLLYGTTWGGGTNNQGVIYSFDPVTSTYTDVHNFDTLAGGGFPGSALIAGDSILYGIAQANTNGQSVIYAFNPTTHQYRIVYTVPDTVSGVQNLFLASDGKFYGTVQSIGFPQSNGVFVIDPVAQNYRLINNFNWAYTGIFNCGVYQHTNGKIYVTTTIQNNVHPYFDSCWGNIYSYEPGADSLILVAKFSHATGYSPDQALSPVGNGLLGGSCSMGGTHNSGTIFTFDPATNIITPIFNFDSSSTGYSATGGVTSTQTFNTVIACPALADSINGPANAAVNQLVNYSVPAVSGAAYSWIITGGTGTSATNNISVTWGAGSTGMVQLIESNDSLQSCHADTLSRLITLLPSGIQNLDEISASLSPNPANGKLRVQTTSDCTSYSIYDITGKLVLQSPVPAAIFDLDVSQFTPGVYIFSVHSTNKQAYAKLTKL